MEPTRQELIDALQALRQEADRDKARLAEMLALHQQLRQELDERCREVEVACEDRCQAAADLQLAELIIANSPAVLFRRLAAKEPRARKMVYVSPNISRFGYTAEDFLNGRIMYRDIIHPEDWDRTLKEIRDFEVAGIETYNQVYRIVTAGGAPRWVEDRTTVVTDSETGQRYHQGIVIDIHRRKEAEDQIHKSEEKYRRIVETTGEGFLLMDQDMRIVDVNNAFCRMLARTPDAVLGQTPSDLAPPEARRFIASHREGLRQGEYQEFESAFLARDGRSVPVLFHCGVLRDDAGAVIGNMAFVTNLSLQKKALELAGEVQRSLLPGRPPRVEGLDIAGRNVSCDEIGGDYFDYLLPGEAPRGPFTVVVGDITGHGVDAALLMTTARAFLRMRASQPGNMIDIISALNRHLAKDVHATGRFMTLYYLTVNAQRDAVEWVRAGHDPAWLYDPGTKRFEELKGPGMALGVEAGYAFQACTRAGLQPGQVLAIGTDGIWEARSADGEMFGRERFLDVIRRNADQSAAVILDRVFQAHDAFIQGTRTEDDVTLVVVKLV